MLSQYNEFFHAQGFGTVATLAWNTLAEDEALDYLTVGETKRLMSIKNEKRRKKWVVGRLAGKFLYLNRLRERDACPELDQAAFFLELTRGHLEAFPSSMYRRVEILPDIGSSANIPRVTIPSDCIQDSLGISISHTDFLSCACLSYYEASIGIDIEMPAFRLDAFYRNNFTNHEKEWVRKISGEGDISPQWLYTVLWSLKESALKSRHSLEASVWEVPNIEIDVLSEVTDWAKFYRQGELGGEFLFFSAGIRELSEKKQACVALTATRHMILVIMKTGGLCNEHVGRDEYHFT